MRGIDFKVEVSGDEQFIRALKALEAEAKAPQRAWPGINAVLEGSLRRQFDTQGANSGGWAALSPAYAKSKAVQYPGQPILRASGALYRSLTDPFDSNAIFLIRPTEMVRGTRLPYAKYVAARRPIFAVTDADKQQMEAAARETFAEFSGSLGFEVV